MGRCRGGLVGNLLWLLGYNRAKAGSPRYERYGTGDDTDISTLRRGVLSACRSIRVSSSPSWRVPGWSARALTPANNCTLRCALGWLATAGAMAGLSAFGQAPVPSAPAVAQRAAAERNAGRFVVVLDAAHGGDDNGAKLEPDTAEKTVTLVLSVRLRSLLTARGFQVVTTREGNVNLDDDARAQIANRAAYGAAGAACVSLHATRMGSGVHLFVSALSPANPARFLAWKTAQAAYVTRSLRLESAVNSALQHGSIAGTDSGSIPVTLARASLPEMDSMACPALAVEIAPIRGADRKVVTEVSDAQYDTAILEALAAALLEWKTESEGQPGSHAEGRP
jgi:N-acetylmuramoyl-L-alanine amidase